MVLFVNHSCEPDVGVAGNVVLGAMRDVDAGEELTTDYAMFDDDEGSSPHSVTGRWPSRPSRTCSSVPPAARPASTGGWSPRRW
ncbi:SET domain-containing protein-lysine N-methyltransferase [Geodermatophilus sp. SYSU D00691]